MTSKQKRFISFIAGILLAAVLLWFVFKDTDFNELFAHIGRANLPILILAMCVHLFSIFLKGWRWKVMLKPIKSDIPIFTAWKYFNIGFAANTLVPGRVGELLRPYLMARERDIRFTSTLATIVTERVIDLVVVLMLLSTMFIYPPVLGDNPNAAFVDQLKIVGFVSMMIALAAIVFLVLLKVKTSWAVGIIEFVTKPLPDKITHKLLELVHAFVDGIGGLTKKRDVLMLVLLSFFAWGTGGVFFYFVLMALHIPFSLAHCFFLQAVLALGVVIPTQGGAGGYHLAAKFVVATLWGVTVAPEYAGDGISPENIANAFGLLSHLMIFGSMTLIGVFFAITGQINLFSVADKAVARKQEVDVENSQP